MTALADQRVFSVAELTQYGSPRTWRRIIASGQIGVIRIGGSVKIPESELERFLAERFTPARASAKQQPIDISAVIDSIVPRRRGVR